MKKEYWIGIIGPTTRDKLPIGADAPLRRAVILAYEKILDTGNYDCSSGWGLSQKRYDAITSVWGMEEEEFKKVESFIKELKNRREK